ncbi:MAG TPA: single-stranded DNA-binding protein [Fimbriimonadaceae bacterium]|nr:single-stranded DNA-binding protein [Fimbriimonadaceae bacterium]
MSINRVVLTGRLTRDPELRTTATGKQVCSFSIAVAKRIKPTDGSPDAYFFNVSAWSQTAEYVSNYCTKGRLVAVDGRLDQRKYTASDGTNREVVEIVADNVQLMDRPRDGDGAGPSHAAVSVGKAPAEDEYDPFADE